MGLQTILLSSKKKKTTWLTKFFSPFSLFLFHTVYHYMTYHVSWSLNLLTPNDPYMGRAAPLTSKCSILYIYSTNIVTEYFKHALHSPLFSLQNAVCFITLTCLFPVLFAFHIQSVLKLKKIIPAPRG